MIKHMTVNGVVFNLVHNHVFKTAVEMWMFRSSEIDSNVFIYDLGSSWEGHVIVSNYDEAPIRASVKNPNWPVFLAELETAIHQSLTLEV